MNSMLRSLVEINGNSGEVYLRTELRDPQKNAVIPNALRDLQSFLIIFRANSSGYDTPSASFVAASG